MRAAAPTKWTRDESEPEPTRKRASQDIRLTESSEFREAAPATAQRVALWELQGGGSSGSPSWTREGFKLPDSRRDLDGLALKVQRAFPPLINLQLLESRTGRLFGKAVLHRAMDSNLSQNLWRVVMGVENTVGHIGAHLSHVGSPKCFLWGVQAWIFFNPFLSSLFIYRSPLTSTTSAG